jgi:hypothetical protein
MTSETTDETTGQSTATESEALVATDRPARYLGQLVKHFSHKIETTLADDDTSGEVRFGTGTGYLTAEPTGLRIRAVATDAEALPRLQDVIARHLVRFGQRDELVVTWQDRQPAT